MTNNFVSKFEQFNKKSHIFKLETKKIDQYYP